MSREMQIIDAILNNPDLVTLNIRQDEHTRKRIATTLIIKGGSEWLRGTGDTASAAILDLERHLPGAVAAPVAPRAMPGMPGMRPKMPGTAPVRNGGGVIPGQRPTMPGMPVPPKE